MTTQATKDLIDAARTIRERAYAPYSRYLVGAAIRAVSGRVYVGANVENAAYPVGQCAEASAIGQMIAGGDTRVAEVAVIGTGPAICTPCGACRQRLREFADAMVRFSCVAETGEVLATSMGELLPHSFGPDHLPPARPDSVEI